MKDFSLGENTLNICLIHVTFLMWLFCLPLFRFKSPVDKTKKHLPELIRSSFEVDVYPISATFRITLRLNTFFHRWVICFEFKRFPRLPNQIFELFIMQVLIKKTQTHFKQLLTNSTRIIDLNLWIFSK